MNDDPSIILVLELPTLGLYIQLYAKSYIPDLIHES